MTGRISRLSWLPLIFATASLAGFFPSDAVAVGMPAAGAISTDLASLSALGSASSASSASWGTNSTQLWAGAAATFVGLFGLGLLVIPRHRVARERLGIGTSRSVRTMGIKSASAVEQALERHGRRTDVATDLGIARISMTPGEYVGVVALLAIVVGFVCLFISGPFLAVVGASTVCVIARATVTRTVAKRRAAFAEQLPDVLQLITSALRSGFGLTQALQSVAEEAEEPASSEVAQVVAEARLGRDLSDAMRSMAHRMDSQDLDWVVAAIDINRDTGGNLSEILANVSATIRERHQLDRQVATLTAEGRLSIRILIVLPFLMGLWQWRANPDNFDELTSGTGLALVGIAAVLMILGVFWARRIVTSLET